MNANELKSLAQTVISSGKYSWRRTARRNAELLDALKSDPRFRAYPNFEFTLDTMCYWVVNDVFDFPKCAS